MTDVLGAIYVAFDYEK